MEPVSTKWYLDQAKTIEIDRRGFPLVPDFSSTIHTATGRTLQSAQADLGAVEQKPTHAMTMKGYIALSRVTDAEGIVISRPFSPLLFQLGPQPFPTLLLEVLRGERSEADLPDVCENLTQRKLENKLMEMKQSVCEQKSDF